MSIELLRRCDFDWVTRLEDIWSESPDSEHFVHASALRALLSDVDAMPPQGRSPLGRVMAGPAGSGKTHLLRHLRRDVQQQRGGFFFLVDGTDIRDFWGTLLLGMTVSLMRESYPNWSQAGLIRYYLTRALFASDQEAADAVFQDLDPAAIDQRLQAAMQLQNFPRIPGSPMAPILRAIFYLACPDPGLQEQATMWLQGVELDQDKAAATLLPQSLATPLVVLKTISCLCAAIGPVVIAFDQLDALITQHHLQEKQPGQADTEAALRAREILQGMGAGLMAIPDQTQRTLVVLSCLKENWQILSRHMGNAASARFQQEVIELTVPSDPSRPVNVLASRIKKAAQDTGLEPAPVLALFGGSFCDTHAARTPREILQAGDKHRLACLEADALRPFGGAISPQPVHSAGEVPKSTTDRHQTLSLRFAEDRKAAEISNALGERGEDNLGKGLAIALALLRYELPLPDDIDFAVDSDFAGGKSYPTLHARLRLIFRSEGDREFHVCLRVLERINHTSFRARLHSAMIEAGIDRALPYRRLILFRNAPREFTGPRTLELAHAFAKRNGRFAPMPEDTVRKIKVLLAWKKSPPAGFEDWLAATRPLSSAEGITDIVAALAEALPGARLIAPAVEPISNSSPASQSSIPDQPSPRRASPESLPATAQQIERASIEEKTVTLGYRPGARPFEEAITTAARELARHVVIRAGSGGGKTVLIKRLIEHAALAGVSSVVLDPGNDLAQMALDWDAPPAGWAEGDLALRDKFRAQVDVAIHTPGRSDGRPLDLPFLPDFSSVADSPDDLQAAVESAVDRLAVKIAAGKSIQSQHKRGILAKAFRLMAEEQTAATLANLAEMLESRPDDLDPGIPKAGALIESLAGSLRAMLAENPRLDRTNHLLDWDTLFGLRSGRARVSILSFAGLPGLERQQDFVARLAESLFGWMRSHPSAGPTGLSGLLVLDEAKDFLPSQATAPSKKPLMRLAAQARKYGVGLVVATQNPKDLDYNAVAQFSTQYFGKANSPQVIEFIEKLLTDKGAIAAKPARLDRGQFYLVSGTSATKPQKISVPLCLTAHPDGQPLTLDDVLRLAKG